MSSWKNIPREILEQILKHLYNSINNKKKLSDNDMIQCQLTCKNWCGPAQKLLYKTIDLNSITDDKVALFFQTVSSTPSDITPGKLVKVLNIGDYLSKDIIFKERNPISVNYFINLQSLFPNVEHLSAENANEIFWTKLIHERYNGNWRLLRGIPTSSPMGFANYAYAAVACCSTLESLTLFYQPFRVRPDSNIELHISTLTQNMKRFTNLKNLVIKIGEDDKGFLEYDSLLEDCRLLQALTFQVDPSYGNSSVPSAILSSDEGTMDLSLIEPRPHIKYFNGSDCISNDDSAIFFIHKFPNLQKMILTKSSTRFDFLSMPVKKKFFRHVAKVPDIRLIYRDLENSNKSELLVALMESTNGADLIVNIKYASRSPSQQRTFTICSRSKYVKADDQDSILYQGNIIQYNKHYENTFEDELNILHDDVIILKYGTQMRKLCIDANSTRKMTGTDIASNLDINYMLRNVFKHCPFLHCLTLCHMNLTVSSMSLLLVTKRQSVTRLEIIRSFFTNHYALMNVCARIPSLNYLFLDKCRFFSNGAEEDNSIDLYLGLNTVLGALILSMDGPHKKVYLKVISSDCNRNSRYFVLKEDDSWNMLPSRDEYKQSLNDSRCWTISIDCKRLSFFTMCFDNGIHQELRLVE